MLEEKDYFPKHNLKPLQPRNHTKHKFYSPASKDEAVCGMLETCVFFLSIKKISVSNNQDYVEAATFMQTNSHTCEQHRQETASTEMWYIVSCCTPPKFTEGPWFTCLLGVWMDSCTLQKFVEKQQLYTIVVCLARQPLCTRTQTKNRIVSVVWCTKTMLHDTGLLIWANSKFCRDRTWQVHQCKNCFWPENCLGVGKNRLRQTTMMLNGV